MTMTLVLVYFTSISILQIFYVAGVSVSGISPSAIYSSISSNSVPTYNRNVQEKTMSSTVQPFKISEGTLPSLNTNLIDNLDTEMSSNSGLGQKAIKILARQIGQQGDNNYDSMLKNTIIKIQPSEMSSGSSLSSTTIPNFEIPVHINNEPRLSNIRHETSKIINTNHINEVNQLDGSSGTNEEFQFGEFGRLSGSISEYNLNLMDSPDGLNKKRKMDSDGRVQFRKNNLLNGLGGSTEFSAGYEAGKGATEGLGKDRGFSGSIGSISFGRKNGGRKGGSAGAERRNRWFSRSNGSIRFDRKNKNGTGGSGGEEEGKGFSGSVGSIKFGRKNMSETGGLGGGKGGDMGISRSNGSIRFGRKNMSGTGGLGGGKGGDMGISRSNGSIRFGRKNMSGTGGLGGGKGGDMGISRSNGSIIFSGKNQSETGGSGGEEKESREFSGSTRFIRFNRENKSEEGGSGQENIKINEKNILHRTSRFSSDGEMNGSGRKRKFGGSVDSIQFGEESGDKELSKSNSININRTGGNYEIHIEDNGFVTKYDTDEESDGRAFGEFSGPENDDS